MRRLGSVQQKIPCVFVTEVKQEQSRKRVCQEFQVVATEDLSPVAQEANIHCAAATEKLDGTCCYVTVYKGQPWLWARLDRKPNKQAEKRFKKYQHTHKSSKGFMWNMEEDFKTVPDVWIPAHGVQHLNGYPVPDPQGHIPGWVPVEKDNKQYCWHSSVVDYEAAVALALRPSGNMEDALEIVVVPLADLLEQTLELIGTNVNGNPYGLGSKSKPVHFLVPHGSIATKNPPMVDLQQLLAWFQESPEGKVEGIVWHCSDRTLVKVHRHHLHLPWPEGETFLGRKPVDVCVDEYGSSNHLITCFTRMNGRKFSRLQDVQTDP